MNDKCSAGVKKPSNIGCCSSKYFFVSLSTVFDVAKLNQTKGKRTNRIKVENDREQKAICKQSEKKKK